ASLAEALERRLQPLHLLQGLVPGPLQRARDESVLRLTGVVLPGRPLGLVTGALESLLPVAGLLPSALLALPPPPPSRRPRRPPTAAATLGVARRLPPRVGRPVSVAIRPRVHGVAEDLADRLPARRVPLQLARVGAALGSYRQPDAVGVQVAQHTVHRAPRIE